ncbi:MAG: hypothetical protein EP330_22075 [Deltaproteobacteria bacterium]|nr:MAG: hypothetical protein EP330_22075 [Deltaproteobacteria bacterium]
MVGVNTLMIIGICAASFLVLVMGIMASVRAFYKVPKADEALVKTGGRAPVISTGGGIWVIPMFHEVTRVSLQAIRVPIVRTGDNAVPSRDMIPAEIKGEMFVQISPQDEQAIMLAVQSLGTTAPAEMAEKVREKIDSQVTDALRTAAFQKSFLELNSQKKEFADEIVNLLQEDLTKLGLTLTAVSVTHVTQGPFTEDMGDVIAAQGRRNVAETVERNRQETNLITRQAEIQIQQQDVEAREKALELELRRKQREADQNRQVREYEAEQAALTKKKVLSQQQAEAEAQAEQERAIAESRARETELARKADIAMSEQVAIRQARAESAQKAAEEEASIEMARAEAARLVAEEEAARLREEAAVARQKAVEEATIAKDKAVEEASIAKNKALEEAVIAKDKAVKVADEQRQQAVETAQVARQTAVAEKRAEEAAARADQARATAAQREAEESIVTVAERARADRQRQVAEIKAEEEAARERIAADRDAYVEAKKAEGERDAAMKRAEAVRATAEGDAEARKAEAEGQADALRIAADAYATEVLARANADAEASDKQSAARMKLAEALLAEGRAAAEAERLMVEARNEVATELLVRDVSLALIKEAPAIVHEIMAPVANVAHDVKILQVNGLGEEGGQAGLPGTILQTGLAAAGVLPFLTSALSAVKDNPDVQALASDLGQAASDAVAKGASALRTAEDAAELVDKAS